MQEQSSSWLEKLQVQIRSWTLWLMQQKCCSGCVPFLFSLHSWRIISDLHIHYIPIEDNPADAANFVTVAPALMAWSILAALFKQLWPSGPGSTETYYSSTASVLLIATSAKYNGILPDSLKSQFSTWRKLVNIIGSINAACDCGMNYFLGTIISMGVNTPWPLWILSHQN